MGRTLSTTGLEVLRATGRLRFPDRRHVIYGYAIVENAAFIDRLILKARRDRFSFFARLLADLPRPLSILDVGGTYDYWQRLDYRRLGQVRLVLLNVFPQDLVVPPFTAVIGDARDLSRYSDGEFDLVFSNSVIGHVGAFADQARMASEIRRVGKRYFVQTPNHGFPLDWRTHVPCFHFLPIPWQAWCFRHFPVGTYPRIRDRATSLSLASRVRNIRKAELPILFPDATIVPERILGITKSFMIYHGFAKSNGEHAGQMQTSAT